MVFFSIRGKRRAFQSCVETFELPEISLDILSSYKKKEVIVVINFSYLSVEVL